MTSYLNSKYTLMKSKVLQNMVKLKIKSGKVNFNTIFRISLLCHMDIALLNTQFASSGFREWKQ